MTYADFSGREIVKALRSKRYRPIGRTGSHVKLRYEHPETDEVRIVTVPLTDANHISQDTYRSIAAQCGADDFDAWCTWIADNC
ncbi:type II toxin-antitoxin system HicA family toxin [Salarchaeum japonicum]|uniref:Type II toxin-antitoxin system HicA family toxin n=1 Tax=Salarchaeum japonicum TaxID=555573 RepID=A0AAV3SZ17_9EURY|nr:type II toxin-antitoxin system HicA family toxin [Salarchaeum japonicum]